MKAHTKNGKKFAVDRRRHDILLMPVLTWRASRMLSEGADKMLAAVVAHLQGNVHHAERRIPQELLSVFHADAGEQLDEGLPGGALDQAGGIFRRVMKILRQPCQGHISGIGLKIAGQGGGDLRIRRLILRQFAGGHIAPEQQDKNPGDDGVDQHGVVGLLIEGLAAQVNKGIMQIGVILGVKQQVVDARFAVQGAHKEVGQHIVTLQDAVKILSKGGATDQHVDDHAFVIHIQGMGHLRLDQAQVSRVQHSGIFAHLVDAAPFQH